MTDNEISGLMAEISCGNAAALEKLYKKMSKPVFFYAYRLLGDYDAAEDVMQDTFVSVLKNSKSYRESGMGRSWIFTIAKNKALDKIRKEKSLVLLDESNEPASECKEIERKESDESFLSMLSPLNEKEREIVILRLLSDMTLTEVASELGIPKGTVFWSYNNAIKKLKKHNSGGGRID